MVLGGLVAEPRHTLSLTSSKRFVVSCFEMVVESLVSSLCVLVAWEAENDAMKLLGCISKQHITENVRNAFRSAFLSGIVPKREP